MTHNPGSEGLPAPQQTDPETRLAEEQLAHESLREEEIRFRTAVESLSEGILITDLQDQTIYVNPQLLSLFDCETGDILARPAYSFFLAQESAPVWKQHKTACLEGPAESYEAKVQAKGGKRFWAAISMTPFHNTQGQIVGILCAVKDISEQRKARAERARTWQLLQRSEQKYRTIVEGTHAMVFSTNLLGHLTYANEAACRVLECSFQDLLARSYLRFVHPEDRRRIFETYAKQVSEKRLSSFLEFRYLTRNGKVGWFSLLVNSVFENDEIVGFTSAGQDVTERKRAEDVLANARQREIDLGSRIQQALLLGRPPRDFSGLRLGTVAIPSQKISGDFTDFVKVQDQCLDIVIGDVMGKGIAQALLGAATKSRFIRAMIRLGSSKEGRKLPRPQDVIAFVQTEVSQELLELESFVTVCYARFNMADSKLELVDCGHPKTIFYRPSTGEQKLLEGDNLPFGFVDREKFEGSDYEVSKLNFKDGDIFFFYSDGVTEASNAAGELFGEERLIEVIRANSELEPDALTTCIRKAVAEYSGSESFQDDFSCVAVKIGQAPVGSVLQQAELETTSSFAALDKIRRFITDFCRKIPTPRLSEDEVRQMELAADEVAVNIMKHAYEGRAGERLQAEILLLDDAIEVNFYHWGKGFDPDSIPEPSFDGTRDDGFGMYIIKNCVDEVRYDDEGSRKCVRLIRKRRHY